MDDHKKQQLMKTFYKDLLKMPKKTRSRFKQQKKKQK